MLWIYKSTEIITYITQILRGKITSYRKITLYVYNNFFILNFTPTYSSVICVIFYRMEEWSGLKILFMEF